MNKIDYSRLYDKTLDKLSFTEERLEHLLSVLEQIPTISKQEHIYSLVDNALMRDELYKKIMEQELK